MKHNFAINYFGVYILVTDGFIEENGPASLSKKGN